MSTLGSNGRFGNQVLQYAFLRIYAHRYGLTVQTPPWIGQQLFGFDDPPITKSLPLFVDEVDGTTVLDKLPTPVRNVDLYAYCQYPTRYLVRDRPMFRSLFVPVKEIGEPIDAAIQEMRQGRTLIAIHLRRGDFGHGRYFVAPGAWYQKWLRENWDRWDKPLLYIASDEIDQVLPDFTEFSPICACDLRLPTPIEFGFYPDFRVLSLADAMAISNSSFSFAASMLNDRSGTFVRPVLQQQGLVPFDPWDSIPVLDGGETPDHIDKYNALHQEVMEAMRQYAASPTNAHLVHLRALRRFVANVWLGASTETLAILYLGTMGKIHRTFALCENGRPGRDAEDNFLSGDALEHLKDGLEAIWSCQYLLAAMLLCSPRELPIDHDLHAVPNWLVTDYVAWLRTTR
jgi:hypothetical protein